VISKYPLFEVSRSRGEIDRLIDGLGRKRLPAIDPAVEEQLTEIGSLSKWPSLRHANENKCVHWHDDLTTSRRPAATYRLVKRHSELTPVATQGIPHVSGPDRYKWSGWIGVEPTTSHPHDERSNAELHPGELGN
jgi:hypothetical protein